MASHKCLSVWEVWEPFINMIDSLWFNDEMICPVFLFTPLYFSTSSISMLCNGMLSSVCAVVLGMPRYRPSTLVQTKISTTTFFYLYKVNTFGLELFGSDINVPVCD